MELESPYIIASLTLVSSVSLVKHTEYYKRASNMGAGAIILPSLNPKAVGSSERNQTIADCLTFDTGLSPSHKMGFAVLGPTEPNVVSLNYGINLAQCVKKACDTTPVIGSVANIGTNREIINAVQKLCHTGIDAIELNFSCPNVVTKGKNASGLTIKLLRKIRRICELPTSLKITPYQDYSKVISHLNGEIDGLTLSNAYIGLIPPDIDRLDYSPFNRRKEWAPSGVYGPFERMLTFKHLFDYQQLAAEKGLSIACVGGIVAPEEGIQAIMLGADAVQLSSAVLWKGMGIFKEFNSTLQEYLAMRNLNSIKSLKGVALAQVRTCADVLEELENRKMQINNEKCRKCRECFCCNRLCLAISQKDDKSVTIDEDLCSGCQMCRKLCPNSAIEEKVAVEKAVAVR